MAAAKKILVVDDEKFLVELLAVNLAPEGFAVVAAPDGESGVEKSLSESPDLILMDLRMPRMDGYEACRRIKSDPKTRHIPVLLISAHSQRDDIKKGIEAGAADYIRKPFDVARVIETVKKFLKNPA
ncbi:MAG: response regulator transcription factor [Elusimicrobiota bacterium]